MPTSVLQWLKNERMPRDIYELLGRKRFDPDVGGMRGTVHDATRELMPCQNHTDAAVAKRAMILLLELGRAGNVLADSEKTKKYHGYILRMIRESYSQEEGQKPGAWTPIRIQVWLEREQAVHPAKSNVIAKALAIDHTRSESPAKPSPDPEDASDEKQSKLDETFDWLKPPTEAGIGTEFSAAELEELFRIQSQPVPLRRSLSRTNTAKFAWLVVAIVAVLALGIIANLWIRHSKMVRRNGSPSTGTTDTEVSHDEAVRSSGQAATSGPDWKPGSAASPGSPSNSQPISADPSAASKPAVAPDAVDSDGGPKTPSDSVSRQNPAPPKPPPSGSDKTPEADSAVSENEVTKPSDPKGDDAEEQARRKLTNAKNCLTNRLRTKAKLVLKEVLEQFPDTKSAEEAKELLEKEFP
jgi:hypothetical protein